jgi:hypothetical protein
MAPWWLRWLMAFPGAAAGAGLANHPLSDRAVKTGTAFDDTACGVSRRTIKPMYALIVAWMFLPFVPVVIAGTIAGICGVPLDEGSAHPCIVFGTDIGDTLYQMGIMGWFSLLTFPTGIMALIVLSLIGWINKRLRRA